MVEIGVAGPVRTLAAVVRPCRLVVKWGNHPLNAGGAMTTIPDSHRDLLDADVATLATIGPDGYPQLSEVWFLVEGDDIRLSLNTSRQKVKNLVGSKDGVDLHARDNPGESRTGVTIRLTRARTWG